MVPSCLHQLLFLLISIVFICTALVAAPLQSEVPYFVDVAAPDFDLEQEAMVRRLLPAEQFWATVRGNVLRPRWRVYLRSDGTLVPDPAFGWRNLADLSRGSTQPVPSSGEFRGRTLSGRSVMLWIGPAEATSWRYEGSEPNVPDEFTLAAELRNYIENILVTKVGTEVEHAGCTAEQLKALLRLSKGPYRFFRPPYSGKIGAQLFVAGKSNDRTVYNSLGFARGEQGWKLISCDYGSSNWRNFELISSLKTEISGFAGQAEFGDARLVLRQDGTWNSDDPEAQSPPDYVEHSFTGYDMNGAEIAFVIESNGRHTWHPVNHKTLHVHLDAVVSQLNHALDQYIELLATGNVKGFLEEGGEHSDAYEFYRVLEKFGEESKEANEVYDFLRKTADGESLIKEYGESNFRRMMKKKLLEAAIRNVDVASTLQELKLLRNQTPSIAPILFSTDFEALYTLPQKETGQPQVVRRMTGQGSAWVLHRE